MKHGEILSKSFRRALLEVAELIAGFLEKDIKKKIKVELQARRKLQARFEKRLMRRWGHPLDLLQTLVFVALDVYALTELKGA